VVGTLLSISTPRVRLNSTARSPRSSSLAQLARSWLESAGAPPCPCRRPPLLRSPTFEANRARVSCTVGCGSSRRSSWGSRYRRRGHHRRERAVQHLSPTSVRLTSGVPLTRGPTCRFLYVDPGRGSGVCVAFSTG
jgi:hypothetical protein